MNLTHKKNLKTLAAVFLFTFIIDLSAGTGKEHKWFKISGNWRIDSSKKLLIEDRGYSRNLGYSELINYNSIIAYKYIPNYSEIRFDVAFSTGKRKRVEDMFFFSVKKNFREFYAFKLTGSEKGFNKISFIRSIIKDKTKDRRAKWNFKINVLKETPFKLEYNKKYRVNIKISKNSAALYINGEKRLEYKTDENIGTGKIGFSNRNAAIYIGNLEILHGKNSVFSDNFTEDTIARPRVNFIRRK